jgi:hypothetical protein
MAGNQIAWWEGVDFALTDKEVALVQKFSAEVARRASFSRESATLLGAAKRLGSIITHKTFHELPPDPD